MAAFITILTDVLLILTAFVMLIDAIIGEKSLILTKQILFKNFANTMKAPIVSISVARWQCPKGYEEAVKDYFGGYSEGCFDNNSKTFFRGKCSANKVSNGTDLRSIPRKDMKLWRQKLICVRRFSGKFYSTNLECKENFIKCGKSDLMGNHLCIEAGNNCPINYIESTPDLPKITDNLTNYLTLNSDRSAQPHYIIFSSHPRYFNTSVLPLEFSVAENLPCINASRFSNTTRTIYLNNDEKNYGCIDKAIDIKKLENLGYEPGKNVTLMDRKYIALDTDTLKNYLESNDLYVDANAYYSKVKVIDPNADAETTNISLYYRPYIGINLKCYDNQKVLVWWQLINESKTYQFTLLILELVNITTLCIFISLLALMKSQNNFLHSIILLGKILVGGVFIYFNISLISACYENSNNLINYLTENIEHKCFDIDTIYSLEIYEVIPLIRTCNRYNMFLHYGSYFYGFCFFVQLVRLIYKTIQRHRMSKKMSADAKNALVQCNNK